MGRSKSGYGLMAGIAIGGDYLNGHTLVAFSNDAAISKPKPVKVWWDGKEILTKDGEEFKEAGVELYRYNAKDFKPNEEDAKKLDGPFEWWEKVDVGGRFARADYGAYVFKLPEDVEIQLVGFDAMTLFIKMPKQPNQAGFCGNFDGNPENEQKEPGRDKEAIGEKLEEVPEDQDLFKKTKGLILAERAHGDVSRTDRRKACPPSRLQKAEKACQHIPEMDIRASCIFDVCQTDSSEIAKDAILMEALKVAHGKDVPEFVGHGQCVDQKKQTYSVAAVKKGFETSTDCLKLLRLHKKVK